MHVEKSIRIEKYLIIFIKKLFNLINIFQLQSNIIKSIDQIYNIVL